MYFTENLRQLLLASPLGSKECCWTPVSVLVVKWFCLDAQGNLIHNTTIYPHPPQNEWQKALKL